MNSVKSNNISLKYQRFATLGYKDIGIIKSEFVAKTQFLCLAESFWVVVFFVKVTCVVMQRTMN